MKKILLLGFVASLFCFHPVRAADNGISFAEFNNGVSARLGSINLDLFEISDIDGNRKLSRNEISEGLKGALAAENLSGDETRRRMEEAMADFDRFDLNHDGWLDPGEGEAYFQNYQDQTVRRQFDQIDQNKDGFLSDDEFERFYRARAAAVSPAQALQNLEKITDSLKQIADNPDQFAEKMFNNIAAQQAGEQFYQMDRNQDGKADRKEYIALMRQMQSEANLYQDVLTDLTAEDFGEMFDQMEGAQKGYLSKEEYIQYYVKTLSEPLDFNIGEEAETE